MALGYDKIVFVEIDIASGGKRSINKGLILSHITYYILAVLNSATLGVIIHPRRAHLGIILIIMA